MTIFDRLAGALERISSELPLADAWRRLLACAIVFEMDAGEWSADADALIPPLHVLQQEGFLFAPAPVIAICVPGAAAIITSEQPTSVPKFVRGKTTYTNVDVRGPDALDATSWGVALAVDNIGEENVTRMHEAFGVGGDPTIVAFGAIAYPHEPDVDLPSEHIYVQASSMAVVGKKRYAIESLKDYEASNAEAASLLMSLRCGPILRRMAIINRPSHFIIERQHVSQLGKCSSRRIPRLRQRSTLRVLNLELVRMALRHDGKEESRERSDRAKAGDGADRARRPYFRRRHRRVLRSARFTHKQGQTVDVAACWCGPKEAVHGGYRYRVRLDL